MLGHIPALNQHTFVNRFTPVQLALGRQPNIPGLVSDERTQLTQLSEEENMRQTLHRGRHRREAEAIVA
jgi:hypothetical protein